MWYNTSERRYVIYAFVVHTYTYTYVHSYILHVDLAFNVKDNPSVPSTCTTQLMYTLDYRVIY